MEADEQHQQALALLELVNVENQNIELAENRAKKMKASDEVIKAFADTIARAEAVGNTGEGVTRIKSHLATLRAQRALLEDKSKPSAPSRPNRFLSRRPGRQDSRLEGGGAPPAGPRGERRRSEGENESR